MSKHKIIIIILTLFNSLYLSYLICHIDNYSVKSFIFLFLVIALLFLFFVKFCSKTANKNINKRNIIFLTIILSITVLVSNYKFFICSVIDTKIDFTVLNEDNQDQKFIDSIIINNVTYENQKNGFAQPISTQINNNIKLEKISNTDYSLFINKAFAIKIIFNDKVEKIKIKDGNEKEFIYQNNSKTFNGTKNSITNTNIYKVKSNTTFNIYSFIRLLLSYQLIFFIVFNLIASFLSQESKQAKCYLFTLLMVAIIGYLYHSNLTLNILYDDSPSYIDYKFNNLLKLKLDNSRPFIYPLIISLMKLLFANHYLDFVCHFQYLIWFISLIYLYKLIFLLSKNYKISSIFTILFALSPAVISWNDIILTESLALSGTTIFIYYIVNYIKTNKLSSGILAVIISLILAFHRSTSIILVIFLLCFWLLRFIFEKQNRKKDFKCFVGSLLSMTLIVIYAILFHQNYGIYSISDKMVWQTFFVNISQGYYKSSNNPDFIAKVESAKIKYPGNDVFSIANVSQEVFYQYTLKESQEIINYCRNKNLKKYIIYITDLIKANSNVKFTGYTYSNGTNASNLWLHNTMPELFNIITFAHAYIAILIELILLIYRWIKYKKVPWLDCGLFVFPLAIILSSFIGTYNEYMRTAICTLPFTYLTYVLFIIDFLKLKKIN